MLARIRTVCALVAATIAAGTLAPAVASVATSRSAAATQAAWTVMVYMSGDNNLESYIVKDLEDELAAMGSNADVQVVALADRGPGFDDSRGDWRGTKLFHPTTGMVADAAGAEADWGERNMGSAQTLRRFVTWSKAHYPADRYALVFWGHGWGWHPGWAMTDDSSGRHGDGLDPDEVRSVLPALGPIDVVAYDACNMAQIEVMELWRGTASAFAGSQEWVGMDGIEYDTVLAQLHADPGMTADEVAVAISASAVYEATWSAVALDGRFTVLRRAVDRWSVALRRVLPTHGATVARAAGNSTHFWQAPTDKDLADLVRRIGAHVADQRLRDRGDAVLAALDDAVLHTRAKQRLAHVGGITITALDRPGQLGGAWLYYRTLRFAKATGWDEFVDRLAV